MYKLQKDFFVFLIILMVSLSTVESTASFLKEPSDQTALKGTDASFTCTIENLEPGYIVQWIQSGIVVLSQNENVSVTVDPKHFQIDANRDRGEYNLTIKSVTLTDDNQYSCAVFENEGAFEPIISSKNVRLTVNYLPDESYPECSETQGNGIYKEGDYIELCCESERASPPVTLQWTTNDKVIRQDIRIDDSENGIRKIIYKFQATAAHNGMSFSCKLTSSADSTYKRNCSTGPIAITYKPQVLIPSYENAVAPGQEILFFCKSTANPVATAFRWELEPAIDTDRLVLKLENQTLQILNTKPKDNGTKIKCFASNTIGDGHAQLILLVHPYPTTTPRSVVATTNFSALIPPAESTKGEEERLTLAIILCIATIGCIMLILLLTIPILIVYCNKKKDKGGNYISKPDCYFEPKDCRTELPYSHTPAGLGYTEWGTGRSVSTDHTHRYDEPIYQEVEEKEPTLPEEFPKYYYPDPYETRSCLQTKYDEFPTVYATRSIII
ncbi:cell adhesion molecule 2-like [Anneissia japonica]|uniref:cell adhesion molecule 2-like n=1 Tax=Anneissia japonica TaxID=1529436 RepID=UPI0014255445|nr:cell adhesion molecule 2-like [Anneissia japonica]